MNNIRLSIWGKWTSSKLLSRSRLRGQPAALLTRPRVGPLCRGIRVAESVLINRGVRAPTASLSPGSKREQEGARGTGCRHRRLDNAIRAREERGSCFYQMLKDEWGRQVDAQKGDAWHRDLTCKMAVEDTNPRRDATSAHQSRAFVSSTRSNRYGSIFSNYYRTPRSPCHMLASWLIYWNVYR